MAVTLSLFAGAGAQFLDNNGKILSGGLIYTYSAGTTTPLATYTSILGTTTHPNPIVLDAAGRIPGGELWLTTGLGYKFVTKDSNNVLIGTYDNIPSSAQPPIINNASGIAYELGTNVTAGSFVIGQLYVITFVGSTNFQSIGASANQVGTYFIATGAGTGTGIAQISRTVQNVLQSLPSLADFDNQTNFNNYSNTLTNPINFAIKPQTTIRTLISKLDDTVSVLDFGAVGDGSTDDSVAFANAIATGKSIFVPKGTYKASFDLKYGQRIFGEGARNCTVLIPPDSATYVIRINAILGSKQHCQIENLSIENPNNVADCYGIFFSGTDVNQINDSHFVQNIFIYNFKYGIYVVGRLIISTFINVEVGKCTKGMYVLSDPAQYAFNLNQFIECRFYSCIQEGIKIQGYGAQTIHFLSCDIELNNSANVAGIAGAYIQNGEAVKFENCYFENNGQGVAVNTSTYANNSYGLHFSGERCFNCNVDTGWMVGSGIMLFLNATSGIIAGSLSNVRFTPESNGWDFVNDSKINAGYSSPFVVKSNNYWNGKFLNVPNATQLNPTAMQQNSSCVFMPGVVDIDLRTQNKFMVFNASGFNITTINNAIPGMELWVFNCGSGTVTIDASLMYGGAASSIAANVTKIYMVCAYPGYGKLIEM
jgi:hypothetical protein